MSHKATNWAHRGKWLWDKTDGHCAYCGVLFSSPKDMTTDHLHPRALGGGDGKNNRFPCCKSCNQTKGSRPLSYLREVLQRRQYNRPAFTSEQVNYLADRGFTFPPEKRFKFYWERLGHTFPPEAT